LRTNGQKVFVDAPLTEDNVKYFSEV
jgi:hypothetical protein